MNKTVAAYYRVSTVGQSGEDCYGLPAQRKAAQDYCEAQGYEIVGSYTDIGTSGASIERPQLAQLLQDSEGRYEAVIVAKWDRLARDSMLDGHLRFRFKEAGAPVESATEGNGSDPMSELTQTILAAVARFERGLITARLASGRRMKKAAGGYAGGAIPYGWSAQGNGSLSAVQYEQEALAAILDLKKNGKSYREISRTLNCRGIKTKKGKGSGIHAVSAV